MSDNITKLVIAGVGAAGIAALAFCLLRGDDRPASKELPVPDGERRKATEGKVEEITKDQVHQILNEIIVSQTKMKAHIKDLTKDLFKKELGFEEIYARVAQVQPQDPLEQVGLSVADFDKLLDKYQKDPQVRESINTIMGAPKAGSARTDKEEVISIQKIKAVHTFMKNELDPLVKKFHTLPNKETYDMKTVTIAAQAHVGYRIEKEFGLNSEDIENAVFHHHAELATDQEFAAINLEIQNTMTQLMGNQFGPMAGDAPAPLS